MRISLVCRMNSLKTPERGDRPFSIVIPAITAGRRMLVGTGRLWRRFCYSVRVIAPVPVRGGGPRGFGLPGASPCHVPHERRTRLPGPRARLDFPADGV